VLSILFLFGALGVGIFISSVAESQVVAMQVAMVATYLPAILLSGFLFDISGMPTLLQGITYLIPARYFVVVTRGVLLKGVGVGAMWPQAVAMIVFAAVGLTLATRIFKKEIKA
jgi:ABC-2 type transport system permease protein